MSVGFVIVDQDKGSFFKKCYSEQVRLEYEVKLRGTDYSLRHLYKTDKWCQFLHFFTPFILFSTRRASL